MLFGRSGHEYHPRLVQCHRTKESISRGPRLICGLPGLSGRTLQVKLPGALSRSGEVIAGVPQGGVLSPTLFNVFITDIDDCCPRGVSINTCKYADDCTQYELVPTGSDSHMQEVMDKLEE